MGVSPGQKKEQQLQGNKVNVSLRRDSTGLKIFRKTIYIYIYFIFFLELKEPKKPEENQGKYIFLVSSCLLLCIRYFNTYKLILKSISF